VDTLYRTEARIEPGTSATEHVTLYCTWHPSDLATGLHGQVSPLLVSAKKLILRLLLAGILSFKTVR